MAENQTPKPPRLRRKSSEFDPTLNPDFATVPAEAEQPSGSERALHALWEIAKTVAFIVLAAVIIRAFLLQPFFVQGESMETAFQDGNYLLINQVSYTFGKPQRGDVVVFKANAAGDPETNYIKRIIGLPGETVELRDGKFYIYNAEHREGVELEESYEPAGVNTLPESPETRWELGSDQFFVVGDNREPEKSSDSRAWGPIEKSDFVGKAWVRVYPLAEVGVVQHERYPNLTSLSGANLLAQP